ncbi:MAG: TolB family protein [Kofleriaceae bacterium]
MRRLVLVSFLLVVVACGKRGDDDDDGNDGGGDLTGLVSIEVKPTDQTLIIDQGTVATSTYTALGTFDDGRVEDISTLVSWALVEPTLGGFVGPDFTTNSVKGGQTRVIANGAGIEGSTGLTILLHQTYTDPGSTGLPTNPEGLFTNPANNGAAPSLVYPNDGVIVPPNLGKLELHFRPGGGNTVFEVSFASSVIDLKVYVSCTALNGGGVYLPDQQVWSWIAESHRGTDPVRWSIRGTDANGTAVGASTEMTIGFAPRDLGGGIYYWTTATGSIMRFDFASTTQTMAEPFVTPSMTGGTCVGCHALSRDGKKLVAEAGGQNDGRILLLDVETRMPMVPFASTPKSNFESWNPDGSQFAGVWADSGNEFNLMIFNGTTGQIDEIVDAGGTAANPTNHPDWSPLGDRIAFANVGVMNTLQMMYNCEIRSVAKVGGAWQPYQVLVPREAGKNKYYPAYAPDGKMLVFNESICNSGNTGGECDADTNPTAKLKVVDGIAGGQVWDMTRANAPGIADNGQTNLTNTFPKWNPFISEVNNQGGRLAWVTFASTRKYGLRNPPGNGTLIWMAAVNLDAPAGTDPSYAAFALPFQDITTSNHIAQWTTQVVGPIQ